MRMTDPPQLKIRSRLITYCCVNVDHTTTGKVPRKTKTKAMYMTTKDGLQNRKQKQRKQKQTEISSQQIF